MFKSADAEPADKVGPSSLLSSALFSAQLPSFYSNPGNMGGTEMGAVVGYLPLANSRCAAVVTKVMLLKVPLLPVGRILLLLIASSVCLLVSIPVITAVQEESVKYLSLHSCPPSERTPRWLMVIYKQSYSGKQ